MKIIIGIFAIFALLGGWIGYLYSQQPKISINHEYAKFILLKGNYRSWTISYSDGLQYDGENWKNLWRWPQFHHVDVRAYQGAKIVAPKL